MSAVSRRDWHIGRCLNVGVTATGTAPATPAAATSERAEAPTVNNGRSSHFGRDSDVFG
jgi:hypothetical protein